MIRKPPAQTKMPDRPALATDAPPPIETQLARLDKQLRQLKAQVRQAQQLAALGTAATTIAHEVNNLLTPIRAYVQYALGSDDTELHRKALTTTMKNVQVLIRMSDRVLEIGAAKARSPQLVAVGQVIDDAIASLCRDPSKDGISLSVHVDESLTVWVDPLQLQQVLFNLFLNARNAMAESHGGVLAVSARREDNRVVVQVKDTGGGIPPELLPRLFEPFQTSKPIESTGKQRCAGLGLSLCRDLIEENDGTISVAGEQGLGTTFTITLPATDEPAT